MYTITFKDILKNYIKKHPVTFGLIAANTIMFFVVIFTGGFSEINLRTIGALNPMLMSQGQYWRIFTAIFLHGSFFHFFFNTFFLYYIGGFMEKLLGSKKYSLLYFVSGIGSSLFVWWFDSPSSVTIGASGALYGIMAGLFLLTFLKSSWFHPQAIRSIRFMVAINVFYTFASIINQQINISVWGHLGGFVVGLIVMYLILPKTPYQRHHTFQQRPRRETHHGRTIIEAEVDEDDTYDSYYKN